MDAGYGVDTDLRTRITALGLSYVAGIQSHTTVWAPGTGPRPPKKWSGHGRPPKLLRRDDKHKPTSVKELALALPKRAWRTITWREATGDKLSSRFARVRVHVAHRDYWLAHSRPEEWLLIEWPDGEKEPIKYWFSTLPEDVAFRQLVDIAKLRWRIERDYQELKQEVGLGHFEGRGWRGFHHHAALCIAAYGFLISERETIAARQAKARQEALAAQAAAEQKAKEEERNARLEAEAEAARQWRLNVDEARVKGDEYAKRGISKWSISEADNPMTDDKDYTVASEQANEKGAIAFVEGTCQKPGRVTFVATLQDALDPKSALGLPDFQTGYIAGNKRINDNHQFPTRFPTQKFRNNILISTLTSLAAEESIETTWRVLAEIETARGPIIIKIPTFDTNIQKLLVACGRQFENAKNRRGLVDAPRAQL